MPDRFTVTDDERFHVVTDAETGAQWPYLDATSAAADAAAANADPTYMRRKYQKSEEPR